MKLFREILSQIAGNTDTGLSLLYTVVAGQGGYFQNVKSVACFSSSLVVLSLKKGEVRVKGNALTIEKYSEGDVLIHGDIVGVERVV